MVVLGNPIRSVNGCVLWSGHRRYQSLGHLSRAAGGRAKDDGRLFEGSAELGQFFQWLITGNDVVNLGYDCPIVFVKLLALQFASGFFRDALHVWSEQVELLLRFKYSVKY